jgi:hypothetical protein
MNDTVKKALENIAKGKKQAIWFDIDGTLADTDESHYDKAEKIDALVTTAQWLYDQGHTIIIATARGVASGTDWKKTTEKQLEEWGIKYHHLIMGYPKDLYVGDEAMTPEEFLVELQICPLCMALTKEKDKIIYEDDDIFVLPTKNMKGHTKRIMAISKEHISYEDMPPVHEKKLEAKFIDVCKAYFNEEPTFALVESTYCSVPGHWHLVACDWKGEEDIEQLHYTPHRAIQTKAKWSPKNGTMDM